MKYLLPLAPIYYLIEFPIDGLQLLLIIIGMLLLVKFGLSVANKVIRYNRISSKLTKEQIDWIIN